MATARRLVTATLGALCVFAGAGCSLPKADSAGPAPTPVPIRRLTNPEYKASVADLFPGYTMPEMSFVPDPKVLGFTNLSSSQTGSLVHMEQYESAAQAIAQTVAADPTTLTGCDAGAQGEAACAGTYLADLGKRAYRRPLTGAEQDALMALLANNAGAVDYPTRLTLVVQAMLLSPKFLFRAEIGDVSRTGVQGVPLTSWELAARLSYFLTGSIPDPELAAAADSGALSSSDELVKQARRLMTSTRSQTQLVTFHMQWLGTDTISALPKDMNAFPDFNPLLAYYMGKETDTFLRKSLFENGGTFAELLLADFTYANGPLAQFYGVSGPDPSDTTDWVKVPLDPSKNVGLLTQASLTATMAKEDRTDPIRRGKFILNQILCRSITPPPPEIVAMFQPLDLSQTARDQLTQHRTNSVCASCHQILDPLGLPFEHYDGMGRWRDDDRGMTIDASGQIDDKTFDGIPQMARVLADMPEARACYITQWLRFSQGKLNGDPDQPYIDWLMTKFGRNTRVVDLVAAMVASDSFRYRTPAMP
jgi:Protein of unknown function (DUF1592)/Protein of unknown function (DUF1588)/Protein of unknown function (DUF1595)/Protein of unknown function (DUF1587)/Protein of unknown function (DUF1585)